MPVDGVAYRYDPHRDRIRREAEKLVKRGIPAKAAAIIAAKRTQRHRP